MKILWSLLTLQFNMLLEHTMKENTFVPTVHEEYSVTLFAWKILAWIMIPF